MEKYEIIKWLEIFDKRIKDIKEVLNIDQISSQIKLYEEQNGAIRVTDIANALECSKPSVNRAIKVLCEDKLLE